MNTAINNKLIQAVKSNISVPLFIGGGITSQNQLQSCWDAGADIVVIGNYIEKNFHKMYDFNKGTLAS